VRTNGGFREGVQRHNNHLNNEFFFRDLNDSSSQSVEVRLHPRIPRTGRQLNHGGALDFEGVEDGAGARAEAPGVVCVQVRKRRNSFYPVSLNLIIDSGPVARWDIRYHSAVAIVPSAPRRRCSMTGRGGERSMPLSWAKINC